MAMTLREKTAVFAGGLYALVATWMTFANAFDHWRIPLSTLETAWMWLLAAILLAWTLFSMLRRGQKQSVSAEFLSDRWPHFSKPVGIAVLTATAAFGFAVPFLVYALSN